MIMYRYLPTIASVSVVIYLITMCYKKLKAGFCTYIQAVHELFNIQVCKRNTLLFINMITKKYYIINTIYVILNSYNELVNEPLHNYNDLWNKFVLITYLCIYFSILFVVLNEGKKQILRHRTLLSRSYLYIAAVQITITLVKNKRLICGVNVPSRARAVHSLCRSYITCNGGARRQYVIHIITLVTHGSSHFKC